ncbi:leucyl aminopeptidase [Hydrogenophaga crassostreae]|uniref:Probable cytosol aminopeptidase n=1 Tax=Hydrogenophaga crassostreae TaxID=1763535 RepID=A0A162N0L7_9BURK|nr:leucyl aminopeptidase [Hydrogenophaga crassostreae]AOW13194.1 leucyl aminopeptidase [Hydrogenophaga crassostreae]OAD42658.1 leucyl aminopeptidase [Hydrogenophaga crassostreae]
MNFELKALSLTQADKSAIDALIVLVADGLASNASGAGSTLAKLIAQARSVGDFETGVGSSLVAYRVDGVKASRVVLVGAGDASAGSVRRAVVAGMGHLKATKTKKVGVVLSLLPEKTGQVRAAVMASADALYTFTTTKPSAKASHVSAVQIGVADEKSVLNEFAVARAAAAGVAFAKEWANRPANHATPTMLANAASKIGRKGVVKTTVLGHKEVTALGMGAFLAVAQGSPEPLRFIVMNYQGGAKSSAPVVLVGKGITFDTGGISIKPASEMDEMKYDMGGAASVLGTFVALAELQPAINVVGLIPACENMPDGLSVKPGDVVTSMSGQTIEILNTDAEGRLVLCDALTYAERFKPRCVIDIATLTGACVIALGGVRSGLFTESEPLAQSLSAAGDVSLDLCWRMPLDDEYAEGLKTSFADMANVAGRAGGSITAAKFLQKFTKNMHWAHLDVAGTAWKSGAAKGATGRPVPLLLQYLVDEAQTLRAEKPAKGGANSKKKKVG